jgi:molybdopterin-guanine dinucleotide biosynthesis protein A
MGGAKATVSLEGRPLLEYPVRALRVLLDEVIVVAKPDTPLPPLSAGVSVQEEHSPRRHPAVGIAHALERAAGRWVLVCAGDMPLLTGEVLRALLDTDREGAPAVVPTHLGRLEPLLALYGPAALAGLREESDRPLREIVAGLGPLLLDVEDGAPFFNVNRPEDLLEAAALLASRR